MNENTETSKKVPEEVVQEPRLPVSRRRKKKPGSTAGKVFAAVLLIAGAAYTVKAQQYRSVFFPNVQVNGIDVSGRTPEETQTLLNQGVQDYALTVKSREYEDQVITAADTGLEYVFDDTFHRLIEAQNPYVWGIRLFSSEEFLIDTMARINEADFTDALAKLSCLREEDFRAPEDARLSDYTAGTGYYVIPETEGTALNRETASELIRSAMCSLQPELDLNEADGLYQEPEVRQDDAVLNASCASLNRYVTTVISYDESRNGTVLDGETIRHWVSLNAAGDSVTVDEAQVTEFVKEIAGQYDTYNQAKPLHTSWGQDITVRGGSYGWRVNQSEEKAWILENIASGSTLTRMPAFSKTAASHGTPDYGNTYVEVNLTAQHLYYYKNGKQIVSSDFVSGNVSKGTVTHTGIYPIAYKQRNATLKGQGYSTPVSFWMPFNSGEGLHDATWRSSFGGSIYKTNGSHGCVNLPYSAAKTIFENIEAGTPVIVYSLGGTGSGTVTREEAPAAAQETTAAAQETTAAAQETLSAAQETVPAETAAAVQPAPVVPKQETAAPETTAVSPVQETTAAGPGGGTVVQPVPSSEPSPAAPVSSGPGSAADPETAGPGMVQPVPQNGPGI